MIPHEHCEPRGYPDEKTTNGLGIYLPTRVLIIRFRRASGGKIRWRIAKNILAIAHKLPLGPPYLVSFSFSC